MENLMEKKSMLKVFIAVLLVCAMIYNNTNITIGFSGTPVRASAAAAAAQEKKFRVTYSPNGAGGAVPVDGNQYAEDNEVTVMSGSGLSMSGYDFAGWSLLQDGNGTTYQPGNIFWISRDITLYAKWQRNDTYKVYYDISGGVGKAPSDMQVYAPGQQASTLSGNGFSRDGFIFSGWSTQPNGGGAQYGAGGKITMYSNVTLYAVWTIIPPPEPIAAPVPSPTPTPLPAATASPSPAPKKAAVSKPKATPTPTPVPVIEALPVSYSENICGCSCCLGCASPYGTNIQSGQLSQSDLYKPLQFQFNEDLSSFTYKTVSTLNLSNKTSSQTRYLVFGSDGQLLGSVYLIPETVAEMQEYLIPLPQNQLESQVKTTLAEVY